MPEKRFVPGLEISQDKNFELYLKKVGSLCPKQIIWMTIDDCVYIRESRCKDEKYLNNVLKHANYHFINKLPYAKCHAEVEGFIELMKQEDIQKDETISDELKSQLTIAPGYRAFSAQQYLLMNIIGRDNLIVGHMVQGEGHLRESFDKASKEGEYDRIFGGTKKPPLSEIFTKPNERGTEKPYDEKLMQLFHAVFDLPLGDVGRCSDVEKRFIGLLKNAEKDCPGYSSSRELAISEICTIILAVKTRGKVGHIGMVNSIRTGEIETPEGISA